MKSFSKKTWLRLWLVCGIIAVGGGGYALLRYQLWPAYRTWSIARMNTMARDFIAANDPRNALLTVRKVLGKRPNNTEALELGAKAADMRSSSEAVLFQRNLCRVEKTTARHLELIRLALKYEVYSVGLESIQAVATEAKELPEYHRLAAETYRRIHRDLAAKYHLISLLALAPEDRAASLALAEVEFVTDPNRLPVDWVARVARLAGEPTWALPATVLQLRAAVARRDAHEAADLALRLLTRPDLDFSARLYVVEAAYLYDPPAAGRMLEAAENQAASRPDDVARIMEFLLRQSQYAGIKAWYPKLPDPARQDERVKLTTAQALQSLADWAGVEKLLRGPRWSKEEFLRLGLLARSYRMAGRTGDFSETWKLAVSATGQDARQVMVLLRNIEQWHWDAERYDLLWKLFNLMPSVAGVQDLLVAHEYRNGNTVNLNKIYARALEASPGDDNVRNNFAYTSLLLGTNANRARQIARDLHLKHPENTAYLTTYTLALHLQGLSRDALGLVEKLDAGERAVEAARLQEALYTAATGQTERARRLLKGLAPEKMLPEEKRLVETAGTEIAQHEMNRGRTAKLAALDGGPETGTGWLAWLTDRPGPAPADLKLADTYYREKNIEALRELLRAGRWTADEHLRYALFAFVERAGTREGAARDYWRQACTIAGRDSRRLRDLENLATHWKWGPERMEVIDRIFENEASNPELLAELLDYYRNNARTSDLARLYSRYVERTNSRGPEAAWCVYYSLLCGMNLTFAQTLAERIHAATPNDPRCTVAYAFSLWRQQRATEAWACLQDLDKQDLAGMQAQLVAAGILIDLGRVDDARARLGEFNRKNALPEEIALAETLSRKVGLVSAALVSTAK